MKILRVFSAFFLIFCFIFTITRGADKIKEVYPYQTTDEEKQILNFWHVESCNMGFGSKKSFLLNAMRTFEIKYQDVLICLSVYDVSTAKNCLENGIVPDLISTGYGLNVNPTIELDNKNMNGACRIGDKTFANVWCKGQYFLVSKNLDDLSKDEFDNIMMISENNIAPLLALDEKVKIKKITEYSSTDAIKQFAKEKNAVMLCTETEIVKLENINESFFSKPLYSFNDRLQFALVTSTDVKKQIHAKRFIEFLLSKDVQEGLNKIACYSNEFMVDFNSEKLKEGNFLEKYQTLSLFNLPEMYFEVKNNSFLSRFGDEKAQNKLKNIIVSS